MTTQDHGESLDPSAFVFSGFDGIMPAIERSVRQVTIRGGQPAARVFEDAVWVPPTKVADRSVPGGTGKYCAGILDVDGQVIELAHHRRGGVKLIAGLPDGFTTEAKAELDEEVMYLGWIMGQFGHFILESLARTWMLNANNRSTRVLFHIARQELDMGWVRQILATFDIAPERIVSPRTPTRIRRVIVPEPLYEMSFSAHEGAADPHRAAALRLLGETAPTASSQPVYLSRRMLAGTYRQIVGEDQLEAVLRENGFLVVYPETMPFADQVRLFNHHRDIFTTDCSAAHTVLFARNSPRLHHITSGRPGRDYFLAARVARADGRFIQALSFGNRTATIGKTPQLLDLEPIISYLDQQGYLRKRLRAKLSRRGDALQGRYDQAWFFAHLYGVVKREQSLSQEIEREALQLAETSWPLSWLLIRYCVYRHPVSINKLVWHFVRLVGDEEDVDRLAQYHEQVTSTALRVVKACDRATRRLLIKTLRDRFAMNIGKPARAKQL